MRGVFQAVLRLAVGGCFVFATAANAAEPAPGDEGRARYLASNAVCPLSDPNWPDCINFRTRFVMFFEALIRGQVGLTGTYVVPSNEPPARGDAPDGTTNDRGIQRRPRENHRNSMSPSPASIEPRRPAPGSQAAVPAG